MMRVGPQSVSLSCHHCQQIYPADLIHIIDASANPEMKAKLLSGTLNLSVCPHCQLQNPIVVPLLYHDASKEICVTHVPPKLNFTADQQEKIVGELLKALVASLPQEDVRGYLFQPRASLTMENFIDQILIADGLTKDDIQQQRKTLTLLQTLLSTPPIKWDETIRSHDDEIDERFIATVSVMHEQLRHDGQEERRAEIEQLLKHLFTTSSVGQRAEKEKTQLENALKQIQEDLSSLGEKPSRSQIRELALQYLEREDVYLETLVGSLQPAFDYGFYQELTATLNTASTPQKKRLEKLRTRILTISERIEKLRLQAIEQAKSLVNQLLKAPDISSAVEENLPHINQHFFQAMAQLLEIAEQEKDNDHLAQLKQLQETILTALEKRMRPEMRLLNELLEMQSIDEAKQKLQTSLVDGAAIHKDLLALMTEMRRILREGEHDERLQRLELLIGIATQSTETPARP